MLFNNSSLTGYIISREFKRNAHSSYDVERHSDNAVYIPKLGRRDPARMSAQNCSFYPLVTSVLVFRLLEDVTGKMCHVYFDSNELYHPALFYPGAKVTFRDTEAKASRKTGALYHRVRITSKVAVLEPPLFSLDALQHVMRQLKMGLEKSMPEETLIKFVQRRILDPQAYESERNVCIRARIVFVQAIIVKWQCSCCYGDISNGKCEHGCRGQSKFLLEGRYGSLIAIFFPPVSILGEYNSIMIKNLPFPHQF